MTYLIGVFFFVCAGLAGPEHILIAFLCVLAGGWLFLNAGPDALETLLSLLFVFIVAVLGWVMLQDVWRMVVGS